MFEKKHYLVFDCEGTNDTATFGDGKDDKPQLPYDCSGVIMERDGTIVDRFAISARKFSPTASSWTALFTSAKCRSIWTELPTVKSTP